MTPVPAFAILIGAKSGANVMGPILQEVAAIRLVLMHVLSRMPPDELRKMSEKIHEELEEHGEGGPAMAIYRAKVDELISGAANLSQ
jgi:hypothetical protein